MTGLPREKELNQYGRVDIYVAINRVPPQPMSISKWGTYSDGIHKLYIDIVVPNKEAMTGIGHVINSVLVTTRMLDGKPLVYKRNNIRCFTVAGASNEEIYTIRKTVGLNITGGMLGSPKTPAQQHIVCSSTMRTNVEANQNNYGTVGAQVQEYSRRKGEGIVFNVGNDIEQEAFNQLYALAVRTNSIIIIREKRSAVLETNHDPSTFDIAVEPLDDDFVMLASQYTPSTDIPGDSCRFVDYVGLVETRLIETPTDRSYMPGIYGIQCRREPILTLSVLVALFFDFFFVGVMRTFSLGAFLPFRFQFGACQTFWFAVIATNFANYVGFWTVPVIYLTAHITINWQCYDGIVLMIVQFILQDYLSEYVILLLMILALEANRQYCQREYGETIEHAERITRNRRMKVEHRLNNSIQCRKGLHRMIMENCLFYTDPESVRFILPLWLVECITGCRRDICRFS